FGIADFSHQFGRDPMGPARNVPRSIGEGAGPARPRIELALQFGGAAHGEPGADPAAIDELAVLPGAEQQRGEGFLLFRGSPAGDDEFLPLGAFDLEPGPGALAAIGGRSLLGDDAFMAGGANGVEDLLSIAGDVARILHWRAFFDLAEQLFEPRLAL